MERRRPHALVIVALIVFVTATTLLVSCGSADTSAQTTTTEPATTTVAPTTTEATTTTEPPTTTAAPATPMSPEDAQAVRDLMTSYWEAYNAYEADKAVSYLDESYRPTKEMLVRDEIGRIKMFGVKLGVSEQSAPVLTGPDEAEMYLDMKEPTGTRTILMRFTRKGDAWTITYSEEVE